MKEEVEVKQIKEEEVEKEIKVAKIKKEEKEVEKVEEIWKWEEEVDESRKRAREKKLQQ